MARTPASAELERGRDACVRRSWRDAHAWLARADGIVPLVAADLELLATAAYMVGDDGAYLATLDRAHQAHQDGGDWRRAARCAFWVGVTLASRGEMGRATGWLGRAHRLADRDPGDCVERGYLLLPTVLRSTASGDFADAAATAAEAAAIGERFGDADLFALAIQERGRALVKQGLVEEGLALLDEAMVAVTGGELSPIVTGLVYCSVIEGCQEAFALRRAQEWTAALASWCGEQPDMVAFTGRCLVHRAEIMQLRGTWPEALEEAGRAGERLELDANPHAAAQAFYQQGEVHRLRGEYDLAETAFRHAGRLGLEPQPGLALLRLAQGDGDAAAAAMRRVLGETGDRLRRARLLPAQVEIMLATGELEEARAAGRELEEAAAAGGGLLRAMAAHARGALELADGDPRAALVALRRAAQAWQELGVPYEAARVRVHVGRACRALGDHEAARSELDSARAAFDRLGAAPDAAGVGRALGGVERYGLTPRELEVLHLVATGLTNRKIATSLVISEHTVARHLQNIFAKLGRSSRTGITAFAFEHDLI